MQTSQPKIDYRFKILYALGIFFVCSSHVGVPRKILTSVNYWGLDGLPLLMDWFPYAGFVLALFVFGSGYFYKPSAETQIGKFICKKTQHLIIPLYLYNIAYGIIVQILRLKGFTIGGDFTLTNILIAPITDGSQFGFNIACWFIIPLFMTEIYNVLIRKVLHSINKNVPEAIFFIISMALGLAGNHLANLGYNYGWWAVLARTLHFFPFYSGAIFYKTCLEKYDRKIPSFWYLAAIFSIMLILICHYGKTLAYNTRLLAFQDGAIMPIIVAFLGVALWLRIATVLEPVIGRNKQINAMADSTLSIMMNHLLGYMLVKTIFAFISKTGIAFTDFDWIAYKTNLWWYYIPRGMHQTPIIYIVGGIVFPIFIQKTVNCFKKYTKNLCRAQQNNS